METQLYYIHGLHSSNQSKKFLELKEYYPNIECFSWNSDDNIHLKLVEWKVIIDSNKAINSCIIASSTGVNFAYQLQLICENINLKTIFINPLLDSNDLIDKSIMPNQLNQYLVKINWLFLDSFLFLSEKDEVLKHNICNSQIRKQIIYDNKATHKFENLNNYFWLIDDYLNFDFSKESNFMLFKKQQFKYLNLEKVKCKTIKNAYECIYRLYNSLENSTNFKLREDIFRFLINQKQFIPFIIGQFIKNQLFKLLNIDEFDNDIDTNYQIRKWLNVNNAALLEYL